MNGRSHPKIMIAAYLSLPEEMRRTLNLPLELVGETGNYPDYFDDPTRPAEKKKQIDPDWEKYTVYPDGLEARMLHFFPAPPSDQLKRIGIYTYLFKRMTESFRENKYVDFIKFSGCLSHAMGDATQPAHIGPDPNNLFLSQLLPVPDRPHLKDFHYHTSVEAVDGECGPLSPPHLIGASEAEAAWKTASDAQSAVLYCRRFLIPTIQALFDNDRKRAESFAAEPVTIAAELTANALYSAIRIARNETGELPSVDLRQMPPLEQFHDLVYGSAVLDGNRNVPPNNVPVTPGQLRINGHIETLPGLGMLPHSGMNGERSCHMTWLLPKNVFKRFTALAGMHATLAAGGAAEFLVMLDGKTVWTSGRMTSENNAAEISVELGSAETLTLKVLDANNGSSFWRNHAYWGKPELSRRLTMIGKQS